MHTKFPNPTIKIAPITQSTPSWIKAPSLGLDKQLHLTKAMYFEPNLHNATRLVKQKKKKKPNSTKLNNLYAKPTKKIPKKTNKSCGIFKTSNLCHILHDQRFFLFKKKKKNGWTVVGINVGAAP